MRHFAVVGSGPGGFYTAEALNKAYGDQARVDIIDRYPVPYGLVRFGVAPDHQSLKAVSKRYDTTAESPGVGFIGNVCVGTDVSVAELLDFYEAVLADIRFAPASRHLQWTKNYLALMLKNRYRHVAALGNRNYKTHGGAIQIHNLEIGIRLLESWNANVILLCACEKLENCHRRVVKAELEKRGHPVEEITGWDTLQQSLFGF